MPSFDPSPHADARIRDIPWWEAYRSMLRLWVELRTDPRMRGKADWSGVVQQTLWEAHQTPALNEAPELERLAWLRRVLANNLADELRKFRCEKRDIGRERLLPEPADDSFQQFSELIAGGSSPSMPLQRAELALQLATALERLPESQRTALVLQHWHGWTLAQIAAEMDRSKLAVAGLLKRGLQQLRRELQPTPETSDPSDANCTPKTWPRAVDSTAGE